MLLGQLRGVEVPGFEFAEGRHVHQPGVAVADKAGAAGAGGAVCLEDHPFGFQLADIGAADFADPLVAQVAFRVVGIERVEQGDALGQQFAVNCAGRDGIADLLGQHDGHLVAQGVPGDTDVAAAVAGQIGFVTVEQQIADRLTGAGGVDPAAVAPAHGAWATGGPDLGFGIFDFAFIGELVPIQHADVVARRQPSVGQVQIGAASILAVEGFAVLILRRAVLPAVDVDQCWFTGHVIGIRLARHGFLPTVAIAKPVQAVVKVLEGAVGEYPHSGLAQGGKTQHQQ